MVLSRVVRLQAHDVDDFRSCGKYPAEFFPDDFTDDLPKAVGTTGQRSCVLGAQPETPQESSGVKVCRVAMDLLANMCCHLDTGIGSRLGVLPTFEENASVFEKDQTDQYNALKRSLLVMRVVNDDTRPPEVVVLMYLLGEGQLHLDIEQQMQDEEAQHLLGIASAFFKMDLSEQDVYWMTRNFWRQLKKLSIDSCPMSKQMEDTLEKEDAELFQHLLRIKAFPVLPVDVWFRRCFAEVLDVDALVRVWDKVIGGSVKFLPQVGAVLLMSLRTPLLQLRGVGDVLELLSKVPKDASDVVVNKVLE
ncbi:hypothetical protein HPB47_010129 [Ixodes persulcatus]|uniref:Uncharacterized protein n=1 Tax=Ixodes persulcatus TaxID=34615 RepID=A0AC60P079_IXOPE|nr:hypothetical protein HPB47_010129 [Ixodes persulcatus]